MNNKEIILQLIKEELKNKVLMYSIQKLGLDCSFFTIDISNIILECAGIKNTSDKLYNWYFNLVDRAIEDISSKDLNQALNNWAFVIYSELLDEKKKENKKNWI